MKKLYVGNLSFKATEEQLQALFSEIGVQPDSLTLLRDRFTGQPRGFGFAEIRDDAEAEKVIAALNGKDFLGRAIVVNEARPQREGGGGGGGGRGGHGGGGVAAVAGVAEAAAVEADTAAVATGNFPFEPLFTSKRCSSGLADLGNRAALFSGRRERSWLARFHVSLRVHKSLDGRADEFPAR